MLDFHPSNPFRSYDWRWNRARAIRENKLQGKARRDNDEYVLAALAFQKELAKCQDDFDRYLLMEKYPDIYGAYLIHQRGGDEERHPMRYAIEARLLASQTPRDIAPRFGIEMKVVENYERLFFNVTEKLNNRDYIMTCVISPAVHAGLSDRDYDLLWKLFGYIYGPVVLDTYITTTTCLRRPERVEEVNAVLAEDARSSLQRKVASTIRGYTVNPFTQGELIATYQRLVEMEEKVGGRESKDVILQNVQLMLEKLPIRPPGDAEMIQNQTVALIEYDKGGAELRTDELLQLTMDSGKPDTVGEMTNLSFPAPPAPVTVTAPSEKESRHDKHRRKAR